MDYHVIQRDEALNRKLDKIVEAKQALHTEIEKIKLETVVEEYDHHDDFEMKERIDELEKTIKENEEKSEEMEKFNQTLILKERKINDELQDGLREGSTRATIGVKLMGELDCKPFLAAMKEKFSGEEAKDRAAELYGLWETYLRDPSRHPYRVVADDLNSETFKVSLFLFLFVNWRSTCFCK
ncbi:hypothetical protein QYF36_000574 [Acer negundo]|nr:hypothetical protein QYF36_000574 [Acer negundo]